MCKIRTRIPTYKEGTTCAWHAAGTKVWLRWSFSLGGGRGAVSAGALEHRRPQATRRGWPAQWEGEERKEPGLAWRGPTTGQHEEVAPGAVTLSGLRWHFGHSALTSLPLATLTCHLEPSQPSHSLPTGSVQVCGGPQGRLCASANPCPGRCVSPGWTWDSARGRGPSGECEDSGCVREEASPFQCIGACPSVS